MFFDGIWKVMKCWERKQNTVFFSPVISQKSCLQFISYVSLILINGNNPFATGLFSISLVIESIKYPSNVFYVLLGLDFLVKEYFPQKLI